MTEHKPIAYMATDLKIHSSVLRKNNSNYPKYSERENAT